jgi:hypothetical protein
MLGVALGGDPTILERQVDAPPTGPYEFILLMRRSQQSFGS